MGAEPDGELVMAGRRGGALAQTPPTTPSDVWRPLAGVKVLDFSALLPGPMAGAILADLGAEVLKIEPPKGDAVRHRDVLAPIHRGANRNKSSLLIDLKSPYAAAVVRRLARWGDVALESFRPGVAAKLGIDHAGLSSHNERIITCSLSGYGQTGPWRNRPGHDLNFLAAAGAFAFSGHWSGKPRRSGLPVADLLGASNAVIAILSAVRERETTGRGIALDISLMDSTLFAVSMRHGLEHDSIVPHPYPTNDLFTAQDGRQIALGVGTEDHLWENFARAVAPTLPVILDSRFDNDRKRREHGDELFALLEQMFLAKPSGAWMALFQTHDVPASLCLYPAEAAEGEQVEARGFVHTVEGHALSAFPVKAGGLQPEIRRPAPRAGDGTWPIMESLGFGDDEIEALLKSGAIGEMPQRGVE